MTTTPPGADPAYDQPPPSGPPPGPSGGDNAGRDNVGGDNVGDDNASGSSARGNRDTFDRLRRLDLRRTPDGWIGGVCAGIAHRVGLDPLVIRAGFIVLGLFFGLGFLVYFLAWALIPDASDQAHLERGLRNGSLISLAVIGAAGILAIGVLGLWGNGGGDSFGSSVLGLLVVGALGYGLYRAWSNRTTPGLVANQGYQGSYAAPPPPGFAPRPQEGRGTQTESGAPGNPPNTPPAPPRPMGPRRGRRLSGGAALGVLATGVVLIILGLFTWGSDALPWGGNPVSVAWAVALAALGAALVVLGIMGRRAGFVGFLALVTAGVASVTAVLPADLRWENSAGDVIVAPQTAAEIEDVNWGFGQVEIDLSNLEVSATEPERMAVDLTAGQVAITVPSDLTVVVNSSVGAGEFIFADYGRGQSREPQSVAQIESDGGRPYVLPEGAFFSDDGMGLTTEAVVGEDPVDLVIDVEVGFGQVRVETQEEN